MPDDVAKVGRHPERGHYDFEAVAAVFDAALICHVGFNAEGGPIVLPTIHARIDRTLYLHGSVLARWLKNANGAPLCITATIVDEIVLARSVFNHSMNYRSAVAMGTAAIVDSPQERAAALEAVAEHVCPGRWADARLPTEGELAATIVVKMPIENASAKIRTGPPIDIAADLSLDVWAGLLPLQHGYAEPIPDPKMRPGIPLPQYLHRQTEGTG